MMLTDQLQSDLIAAMKSGDTAARDALRHALTRIKEAQTATSGGQLSDDEVRAVLARGVKDRDEAAEAYDTAGRPDRAQVERAQRVVLARYLPAPLEGPELEALVDRVLAGGGWRSVADMGAAMRAVQAEVDGRAPGKAVATLVRARLGA